MTFNIAVQNEQEQRVQADLVAVEVQIDHETETYAEGQFDGVISIDPNPDLWSELTYRNGYLAGLTRYYDSKYQTVISNEPF
jgi:hypothetical protein